MKNNKSYLITIYLIISFLYLLFISFELQIGIYATKPLLMAVLAWWYYSRTMYNQKFIPSKYFLTGILFSLLGDTFLMFQGNDFFLFGLSSFLVAHILYILSFVKYPKFYEGVIAKKPLISLPFLLYMIVVTGFLWENLGNMKLPVLLYSAVITLMAICAMNMKNRIDFYTFLFIISGAMLFVISDTVIAISKFKFTDLSAIPNRLIIMASYLAGQYLLAMGSSNAAKIQSNSSPVMGSPK